uniref:Uncharacterized protein n=1 Tax=Anguilla anguilla TaxID=7936 RepID=A0A0E9V1S1_ANGAN
MSMDSACAQRETLIIESCQDN